MDNSGGRTGVGVLRGDGAVGFAVQSLANRYTSIGGQPIFHEDAGNLTVDKDGYKHFYDYENRVVKIQKPDGLGGWDDVAEMAYDALGRRIRVIDSVASATTLYYYNPDWQVLAEYDGAKGLQRYFVYGNYIDEPLVMHRQSDGEDYYYGQDHLYSTAVLLDDSGNVAERYEYDAYGTVLVYTEDGDDNDWFDGDETTATASAKGNPYTFTGRRVDVLNGDDLLKMHYRHRDYDLCTGRFLQHDPHGINPDENWNNPFDIQRQYSDGCGLQVYAQGDPVNNRDGWGLTTIIEYRNLGPLGHAGLLVDGRDIDFGPLSNITNEWVYAGISPWERSDGNNDQTGPDPTANRYNLTMSRSWLRKMDAGPKKGVACCKLTLKNAAI